MMNVQNVKVAALAVPQLKDNGAVTTVAVDTLGYDEALAIIAIGSTDIAMTALKMTESDDNSTYTDVSGADFNGSTTIDGTTATLPDENADSTIRLVHLDLRKRKRYLKLSASAGDGTTGTYISGMLVMSKAEQAPKTGTAMGATAALRV